MFDINDKTRLEAAYIFLRAMSAAPVPAENKASRDVLVATVKREIREFNRRPASDICIVEERGCDGYIELVQLPAELDDVHKADAADWFRANRYLEFFPTPYDCSGQKFTNWFKLFRRRGHWFAYHSVSIDV